ncbi:hypothetical protein PAXRUDRAFT_15052 [Paxillus rubicundulus Ve08.2h10]|uniref:Unplaced genomic scaffold scaffold_907, whole genome shotgun sequence n=1 Tax=Paxillus rubicundulus Ve08.2h10 TaxID=930991 RepID=A0A0D0DCA9_9AGAM|nr:hypothetical protein PAXRUDRAFT_15052 [Paxillus rubicundulus Ve08.2h10]
MTPPSTPQAPRHWPCSESLEAEAQQEEKRLQYFATSLCMEKGLPEDALEEFVGLSQPEMMMTIHADIPEMQMQGRKSNAKRFVNSDEFQIYAKKNLQTFKIPEAALEDPEMTEKIVVLISQLLMSARSNMKQKITNHIDSKLHISVLTRSLAPGGGYEIMTAHWARIAFLVAGHHISMIQ